MIHDGLVRRRRAPAGLRLVVFGAVLVLAATAIVRTMAPVGSPAGADTPLEAPAAAPMRTPAGLAELGAPPGSPAPGGDPARNTLVLYDDGTDTLGRQYAIQAANLASHSGAWDLLPVSRYRAGDLARNTAAIYVGTGDAALPTTFLTDVNRSPIPVLWMGSGIDQLFRAIPGLPDRLGWSPGGADPIPVTGVTYERRLLSREAADDNPPVRITVRDPGSARVLGVARHDDGSTAPWAVRSGSLTYVGEVPFSYAQPGDRSLAAADLIDETARPDGPDRRRALIRIEDVGPNSDPDDIRAISD